MTAMPLNSPKRRILTISFLILLLLIAFFLRAWPVFNDTTHFSFDQGLDIIMTKQLVVDHKVSLISRYSGLQGVLMGPIWTYFLAPPFFASGGNPGANVIYLALFSLATTLVGAYLLAAKLGRTAAIMTLFFLLFAPAFTSASQVVLSPQPLIYLYIFSIILSVEVFIEKNARFAWLLLLLAGLLFQFEIAFALFALLSLIAIFVFFRSWWLLKQRSFWLGVILFLLTLTPQLIFDLRHHFLIIHSLTSFLTGSSNSLYGQSPSLILRFPQRLSSFYEDVTAMAFFGPWYVNILLAVLAIWGWQVAFVAKKKIFQSFFKIVSLNLLTFFVGFSLYPGPIWGWYRSGLPIVYIILLALPLALLWQKEKMKLIIAGSLVFLFTYNINPVGLWQSFFHPNPGGVATLRNQKQVIDQIYSLSQGRKFSYFVYTPPVYNYIWQHDFWWYGLRKYGYLPSNWESAVPLLGVGRQVTPPIPGIGLTYLIIEPDGERPGEGANWVKSYIKYGQTIRRIPVRGGIIVEERII